jgi:hypothetical protein
MIRNFLAAMTFGAATTLLASNAAGATADVFMFPEDGICIFGWVDELGNVIGVEGEGVAVFTNNERGNATYNCHGAIPPDLPSARDTLPLLGFPSGAGIFNFENTMGILCMIGPIITADWQEVVTPSGQVQITCHSPESP